MKTDRLTESMARAVVPDAGHAHGDEQLTRGWPLTKPFPFLLTPADLQHIFQIAESTYFKHLAAFARFEAPAVIGPRRYLGAKVRAFLESGASARVFGAKRGPRRVQLVPQAHAAQSGPHALPEKGDL